MDSENKTCILHTLNDELDAFKNSTTTVSSDDSFSVIFPYILLSGSLICAFLGQKILKPSFALIGFVASGAIMIDILYTVDLDISCDIEIMITLFSCLICAVLSIYLIKFAAFILGFATSGIFTFYVFKAIPELDVPIWQNAPVFMGFRLFPYWIVSSILNTVFGAISYRNHKKMAIVITAVLGGYGVTTSFRSLVNGMEEYAHMIIFIITTFLGLTFQYYLYNRGRSIEGTSATSE